LFFLIRHYEEHKRRRENERQVEFIEEL